MKKCLGHYRLFPCKHFYCYFFQRKTKKISMKSSRPYGLLQKLSEFSISTDYRQTTNCVVSGTRSFDTDIMKGNNCNTRCDNT